MKGLNNMNLLRGFYLSIYYHSNLKNLRGNSFKIGAHFKEQPLKTTCAHDFLKKCCCFCSIKAFVFSVPN